MSLLGYSFGQDRLQYWKLPNPGTSRIPATSKGWQLPEKEQEDGMHSYSCISDINSFHTFYNCKVVAELVYGRTQLISWWIYFGISVHWNTDKMEDSSLTVILFSVEKLYLSAFVDAWSILIGVYWMNLPNVQIHSIFASHVLIFGLVTNYATYQALNPWLSSLLHNAIQIPA